MSKQRDERLAQLPTIEERAQQWSIESYDDCAGTINHESMWRILVAFAQAEVKAATTRLRRELNNSERCEGGALEARDRYEDVIQEVHVALGGSGEWAARSGCDHVEGETGDLCADVLVLAPRSPSASATRRGRHYRRPRAP